ncbi:MAG: hypothetical protein BACD_02912 [Bacteroides rodentium]
MQTLNRKRVNVLNQCSVNRSLSGAANTVTEGIWWMPYWMTAKSTLWNRLTK